MRKTLSIEISSVATYFLMTMAVQRLEILDKVSIIVTCF
jgi:hypothetical protein